MNTGADPFAGYEPNTTGGTEDLGGGFDLTEAAGRAARTGCVFGESDQRTASSQFPPPWPGLGSESTRNHVQIQLLQVSRGLPPAKAWQDCFTIRLGTWANVISPEFETELVRKFWGSRQICRGMVQLTDSLRMRSALTSTTRCYRTSLARTCCQAARF